MVITATEFKTNMGKYLKILQKEDIFITKNGKTVAKMVNPNVSAVDAISGILAGKIDNNYDHENLKTERLSKYEINPKLFTAM